MSAKDIPFDKCCELAEETVKTGFTIFQKFTCSHCGSRQTMGKPNAMFETGTCEECKKLTIIDKCGFMAVSGGL